MNGASDEQGRRFLCRGGGSLPSSALLALAVLMLAPPSAQAQLGDEVPQPAYYGAINELYGGEYRDAERDLRRLAKSGVKSIQARWIDSICYHAMLGEVQYHEGHNAEALVEFDQACLLLLSYPKWMQRVKFEDPRPDANLSRRQPPWGTSSRRFVLGNFPRTMQVLVGDAGSAQEAVQKGGVVAMPQFWRVNVTEIIRTSALAIRRRNEILGPLGKHDRISKELASAMSRGTMAPPNHWSQAWVDLLAGVAQAGIGNTDEARARLDRAVIVGGQLDHPLTGVALLEQGRLAMAAGDHRGAAQLLAEASISGFYYDDADVVTESLRLGWLNHLMAGSGGVYPPLDAAAAWAQANRLWHVAAMLRLAEGENLIRLGQLQQAAAIVEETGKRLGDMKNGRPGIELLYLQAMVQLGQNRYDQASELVNRALTAQAAASVRNFQIQRTGELYDGRQVSSRIATELYRPMLDDPSPTDWAQRTLDTLAVMRTPHDDAFGRWFLAALDRKDEPLALEVSERAKRHRFLVTLPLGGRLLALRTVLESPEANLVKSAALERQQLLSNFPEYTRLAAAGEQMHQRLRGGPVVAQNGADGQAINDQMDAWSKNADAREQLLLSMALSPAPSTILFPPLRTAEELQNSLGEGEALVAFHSVAGSLYAFLLSEKDLHVWQLGDERQVQKAVTDLLRTMGNFSANRQIAGTELSEGKWQDAAAKLYHSIFADGRFDLAKTTDLVIVPDSWLWYLPFEMLVPPNPPAGASLVERLPVHYGPMAALAVGDTRPFRRAQHTGIVANELANDTSEASVSALKALEAAVVGPVRFTPPLLHPGHMFAPLLDELVVLDNVELERADPYGWSPLPRPRGKIADSLSAWMGLPIEGPERVVLAGFPTAAETGLKSPKRGEGTAALPGSEIFDAVCGLMASGTRTVLLSRWRTGGQMNLQLVREFVQELPQGTAAEAWRRSILLARETPLDAAQEPRLKKLDDTAEPPEASHPFFWAGYLLVDTGTSPAEDGAVPQAPPAADAKDNKPAASAMRPQQADAKTVPSEAMPKPTQPTGSDAPASGGETSNSSRAEDR